MNNIIVDKVVFCMDNWEWYNKRKHQIDIYSENSNEIFVFKSLIDNKNKIYYEELTGWEFYNLLNKLMYVFSDLDTFHVELVYTPDMIEKELLSIERRVVYWALTENHTKEELGTNVRTELLNKDQHAFNRFFQSSSYAIMKIIWQSYEHNITKISKYITVQDTYENFHSGHSDMYSDIDSFIFNLIKYSCFGDYDEFILNVMDYIKFKTMTQEHCQLAYIRGLQYYELNDINDKLPECEIWRRIIVNYFDEFEGDLKKFYKRFRTECILFLFKDYLYWSEAQINLVYIPVYKIIIYEGKICSDIRSILDIHLIKNRVMELYQTELPVFPTVVI